jgi:hypothetical protein
VCEVKNQTRNVTGFGGELRVEKKTNQRTGEGRNERQIEERPKT